MNVVMMYMSGSSIQIFSIMMTGMLFLTPYGPPLSVFLNGKLIFRIKALMVFNQPFIPLESPSTHSRLLQVKLVYLLMQLVILAMGVYKVWIMGLLPTSGSDFLAWKAERPV
jgi:ER membrane protein complex subunit 4